MATMGHGAAMQRAVIDLLRGDPILSDSGGGGLLYPDYAPKLDTNDYRVYEASVRLPGNAAFVRTLPRVLVEVIQYAHDLEQEDPDVPFGPVKVFVHTIVPSGEDEAGEVLDAYITRLILSTSLSDARIIAPKLTLEGQRRRERIDEFNGAWQFVSGFAAANAGSLQ